MNRFEANGRALRSYVRVERSERNLRILANGVVKGLVRSLINRGPRSTVLRQAPRQFLVTPAQLFVSQSVKMSGRWTPAAGGRSEQRWMHLAGRTTREIPVDSCPPVL